LNPAAEHGRHRYPDSAQDHQTEREDWTPHEPGRRVYGLLQTARIDAVLSVQPDQLLDRVGLVFIEATISPSNRPVHASAKGLD